MPCLLENRGTESLPLPYPLKGILAPGERTIINTSAATMLAALGTIARDSTLKISDVTATEYDAFRVGVLLTGGYTASDDLASTATAKGGELIGQYDPDSVITATTVGGATREVSKRQLAAVADTTALAAVTAAQRSDGALCVALDTLLIWRFDAGSAAGASDWVVVPDAGTGRWLRTDAAIADLSGTTATLGGELVGLYDPNGVIAAATLGAAAREIATELNAHRPGIPMQNILRLLGAPGAAVEGNTVTIGTDVFEFRSSTPPAGGTAGRIWVYNGASSAASRANLIASINGVIDANITTYDGALTETFLAAAGITVGDILILSADAAGGSPVPSATATACAETLDTVTDIWDNAACQYGRLQAHTAVTSVDLTIGAEELARATLDVTFPFAPLRAVVINHARPQNEAWAITGNTVSLTLAGGASPNNQSGDVISVIAFG